MLTRIDERAMALSVCVITLVVAGLSGCAYPVRERASGWSMVETDHIQLRTNIRPEAAVRLANEMQYSYDLLAKYALPCAHPGNEARVQVTVLPGRECLTRTGTIASVTVLKSTGFPSYDQKIVSTIRTQWRYRPFMVNGKPERVCTAVTFIYTLHIVRPPSNDPGRSVELMRIAGERNIVPDDATRTAIIESGRARVISSYKVCITSAGTIASVRQLKSTGFPRYDEQIMTTIRSQWRYRQIVIDGKPTNVCTAVTFVYAPDVPPPPPPSPLPRP